MPLVGVVMGSKSDTEAIQPALDILEEMGFSCELNIISAHRTPDKVRQYGQTARERGLEVCFDCDEFPCDEVAGNLGMIQRGEEYKKLGKDRWWEKQAEEANRGFEHHTKKYYQVRAGKKPEEEGKGHG